MARVGLEYPLVVAGVGPRTPGRLRLAPACHARRTANSLEARP